MPKNIGLKWVKAEHVKIGFFVNPDWVIPSETKQAISPTP